MGKKTKQANPNPVVDSDSREHVVVLQHAPSGWRNCSIGTTPSIL